jgi:predicted acyltransferase
VVLFSSALFFGAISNRIGNPRARVIILGIGIVVLVGTLAWVTTFPISFSV